MNSRFLIIHPGGVGGCFAGIAGDSKSSPALWCRGRCPRGDSTDRRISCPLSGNRTRIPRRGRALKRCVGRDHPAKAALDEWLRTCGLAIAWMSDHDGHLSTTLSDRGVSQIIIGSPLTERLRSIHQSDRILETLSELKLDPPSEQPLNIPEAAIIAGRRALNRAGVSGIRHMWSFIPVVEAYTSAASQPLWWTQSAGRTAKDWYRL